MAAEGSSLTLAETADGNLSESNHHEQVVTSSELPICDSTRVSETSITPVEDAVGSDHMFEAGSSSADAQAPTSVSSKTSKQKETESSIRLSAPKGTSPGSLRRTLSGEDRKVKVEEARKQKIVDQQRKEEERRASVLERKRKLDEEERAKKEALFKRLTEPGAVLKPNPAVIRKQYSASTSNLLHLKKAKVVTADVIVDDNLVVSERNMPKSTASGTKVAADTFISSKRVQPQRPASSLGRLHNTGNETKTSLVGKTVPSKIAHENSRPSTAEPNKPREPLKSPIKNANTTLRPATALGVRDKKRDASSGKLEVQVLPGKPKVPPSSSKSTPIRVVEESVTEQKSPSKSKGKSGAERLVEQKDVSSASASVGTPVSKSVPKASSLSSPKSTEVKVKPQVTKKLDAKSAKSPKSADTSAKDKKADVSVNRDESERKKTASGKKGEAKVAVDEVESARKSEEEAKRQLAEHRRKAKEEAEAKAKAEKERDEEERKRREEEEARLAEELKQEELRQASLLQQLKAEEEERRQRMMLEKEQKDREEREKMEKEQKMREEEIERKAKLELEKKIKEQEKMEQEQDAERVERKKRVEMIMARVSKKGSETIVADASPSLSPSDSVEENLSQTTDVARLKVDSILRAKGICRSTEELDKATSNYTVSKGTGRDSETDVHQAWVTDRVPDFNLPHCDDDGNACANEVPHRGEACHAGTIISVHTHDQPKDKDGTRPAQPGIAVDEDDVIATINLGEEPVRVLQSKLSNLYLASTPEAWSSTEPASRTALLGDMEDIQSSVNSAVESEPALVVDETNAYADTDAEHRFDEALGEDRQLADLTSNADSDLSEKARYNVISEDLRALEHSMKVRAPLIEEDLRKAGIGKAEESREGQLWQVMEGKVEFSECF